jgi:hypothetical protein
MILVTASATQRLLYFKFIGKVTAAEVSARMEETELAIAQFKAGFRLLSDLDELESMDEACVPDIGNMMDLFKASGIELVVRIIPDPRKDFGLNIMSVFHYGRQIRTVTCENFSEAMRALKI